MGRLFQFEQDSGRVTPYGTVKDLSAKKKTKTI